MGPLNQMICPHWVNRTTLSAEELKALENAYELVKGRGELLPLQIEAGNTSGAFCMSVGLSSRRLVVIDRRQLQHLLPIKNMTAEISIDAWKAHVSELSDIPHKLQSEIRNKSRYELETLLGHFEQNNWISEEELYFALRHEIVGHLDHRDNEKKAALYFLSFTVTLIFCSYLLDIRPQYLLVSVVIASLALSKLEYYQELHADAKAVEGDRKAQQGALLYLKKCAINEIAGERYYQLTGKVFSAANWVAGRINKTLKINAPSAKLRYRAIFTKILNSQNSMSNSQHSKQNSSVL